MRKPDPMRYERFAPSWLLAGVSAFALVAPAGAHAQANPAASDAAAQDAVAAGQPVAVSEVIVTGSRIPRPGFDTVRPIETVGRAEIDARAFTNITDALAELPAIKLDLPRDQDNFVIGQSFVDLFGLGSQRTLTLVNGRRFVSSNPSAAGVTSSIDGGLQVDLAAIPSVLVDRIDVAKLAGAAVYGSDAIAGTINVILRHDFQGVEVSGQRGISEQGDLGSWEIGGVAGVNSPDGRGNIVAAVEYTRSDSALFTDRPRYSQDAPALTPFARSLDINGDGLPDTEFRIYDDRRTSYYSQFGAVAPPPFFFIPAFGLGALPDGNFYTFGASGKLAPCTPGATIAGNFLASYGGDCGSNPFDSFTLRPQIERLNLAALGHYDITDRVRFSFDALFSDIKAVQPRNAFAVNTALLGPTPSGVLIFNTSNPFLPDQARAILEGNGVTTFGLNRESDDLIDDGRISGDSRTWRVAGGFNGDFNLGERRFNWDVSAVFGQARIETRQRTIIDARLTNALDAVRVDDAFLSSLVSAPGSTITDLNGDGLVNANDALIALRTSGHSGVANIDRGSIVCRVNGGIANGTVMGTTQPPPGLSGPFPFAEGCLPVNVFGDAQLLNSQAALDFVDGGGLIGTEAENQQLDFTASLTGDVIKLPAGWLKANIGIEARTEDNAFTPGVGFTSGVGRFPVLGPTGGHLQTVEGFGEVVAPIVSPAMAIPLADLLEASASVRQVHDETRSRDGTLTGGNDSTTYEVSGRWAPVRDLTFRASYTSAIRSPALVELFRPDAFQFAFGDDPCDMNNVNGGLSPAVRRANCIAAGIDDPDTFTSNLNGGVVPGRASGNPDLKPERSRAYNIGAVFQPRWVKNLGLSIDYYRINIDDRITLLSLTQILDTCYDSPSYPNSPFCGADLFVRDPTTGFITFARVRPFNASQAKYRAVEGRLVWAPNIADLIRGHGDLGQLTLDFTVLRQLESSLQIAGETQPTDSAGTFGTPGWSGTLSGTYAYKKLGLFWRTIWQDSPKFAPDNDAFITRFGPGDESQVATPADIITGQLGPRFIHYAAIWYDIDPRVRVQFNVDNVFNRQPSRIEQAVGQYGVDEIYGRRFTFTVKARF